MKIGIISTVYPPEGTSGGNAAFFYELANALVQQGHEVLVATLTSGESRIEEIRGVRVERVKFDSSDYFNFSLMPWLAGLAWNLPRAVELYRKLKAAVDAFAPDVIECVDNGFEGLFWSIDSSYPLVLRSVCPQFHTINLGFHQQDLVDKELVCALEVMALRCATSITTPSRSMANIIATESGIEIDSIKIIRNPLSLNDMISEERADSDNRLAGELKLLYIGRIEKLKGCDILVEALPAVLKAFPLTKVQFVGSPSPIPGTDVTFADILKVRLTELGVLDHCSFTGAVPREQLGQFTREADICVFPSRYDSSPYACLEAMSRGAAVVASNAGGIPEYIEDGLSGILFQSEDSEDLAIKIIELGNNQAQLKRIRSSASEHVRKLCAPEVVAKQSVELYEQTIKRHKERSPQNKNHTDSQDFVLSHLFKAFDDWRTEPYLRKLIDEKISYTWQEGYKQGFNDARKQLSIRNRLVNKLKRTIGINQSKLDK